MGRWAATKRCPGWPIGSATWWAPSITRPASVTSAWLATPSKWFQNMGTPRQLAERQVDADHPVAEVGEDAGHGLAGTAPGVDHHGARRQPGREAEQQGHVVAVVGSVGQVRGRGQVVAAAHHRPRLPIHRLRLASGARAAQTGSGASGGLR